LLKNAIVHQVDSLKVETLSIAQADSAHLRIKVPLALALKGGQTHPLTLFITVSDQAGEGRITDLYDEAGHRRRNADRQFYAFQAGVIQHLRSKGMFPELDALYRPDTTASALNYNDQDAFALLKQRCGVFAAIEQVGIQKLLQAGEEEIRAIVEQALPPPSQPGSVS
jgi:hypothetical protein